MRCNPGVNRDPSTRCRVASGPASPSGDAMAKGEIVHRQARPAFSTGLIPALAPLPSPPRRWAPGVRSKIAGESLSSSRRRCHWSVPGTRPGDVVNLNRALFGGELHR